MIERIVLDTLVTGIPLVPAFLGIYLVLRIRQDFDLSIEGSFALGGAVAGVVLTGPASARPELALLASVAAGCLVGLVASALHLFLRIPVLLAGLVMNMGLFTVTFRVMKMTSGSLSAPAVFVRREP